MKKVSYPLLCGLVFFAHFSSFSQEGESLPKLSLLRAEEDYSNLRGYQTSNILERLKFIPLGERSYLSVGGEARYLAEYFHNDGWDETSGTSSWLLNRYMLHTDWHFGNFRTFVQLHTALQTLSDEPPRGVDKDELDFHQLFMEYKMPFNTGQKLTLRVGRQEFWLGSRRLISVREGPNLRISFDAARLIFERPNLRIDGIYAQRVFNEFGMFDNGISDDEKFWGVYSVINNVTKGLNLDLYYLGFSSDLRTYDEGIADETRHSIGARFWKKGRLDINAEVVYQFGDFGSGDINAYTASLHITQETEWPGSPTLGLKADLISGDRESGDGDLETFNALYPRGAYFGLIALVGPANLIDIHPSIEFPLGNKITFTLDWDIFWRHRTADGLYGPGLTLERSSEGSSNNRYIGHQPGFEVARDWGRYLSLSLEGSYFVTSDFFEETGSGENVLHFATTARFKF